MDHFSLLRDIWFNVPPTCGTRWSTFISSRILRKSTISINWFSGDSSDPGLFAFVLDGELGFCPGYGASFVHPAGSGHRPNIPNARHPGAATQPTATAASRCRTRLVSCLTHLPALKYDLTGHSKTIIDYFKVTIFIILGAPFIHVPHQLSWRQLSWNPMVLCDVITLVKFIFDKNWKNCDHSRSIYTSNYGVYFIFTYLWPLLPNRKMWMVNYFSGLLI